jgi:hypothetical protein
VSELRRERQKQDDLAIEKAVEKMAISRVWVLARAARERRAGEEARPRRRRQLAALKCFDAVHRAQALIGKKG